jgi:hypothetical protein
MKKTALLLVTSAFLFSGAAFAQTGKDGHKTKAAKDSTAVKKPMPNCPGKTCGKKKG